MPSFMIEAEKWIITIRRQHQEDSVTAPPAEEKSGVSDAGNTVRSRS